VKCFCSSYGVEEKTNFNTIKLCVGFLCLGKVIIIHFLFAHLTIILTRNKMFLLL
jgi:hypothetical protein